MRYIIRPGDAGTLGRLGGKAAALAALHGSGIRIPTWFVLTPDAFDACLDQREHQTAASSGDRAVGVALRAEPLRELAEALASLCPNGEPVAIRSSAVEEDGRRHSFAGQFESFLFVPPAKAPEAVAAVWRSAFGERLQAYRRTHGLAAASRPPAVLIQRMVNANRSGVAFSADPISARRGVAVVSALYGLGTSLVSGEQAADTYRVDRDGQILERVVAEKRHAHCAAIESAGGVRCVEVAPEDVGRAALTDDEIRAIAAMARRAAHVFGCGQDIEWAIEDDGLYLLQARPITALSDRLDPDGTRCLWDNSNIVESYAGVTSALTFSFARRAYEEVYRQFCRVMRVPAAKIASHDRTFRCMLGLIGGRVYYNLLSWYRVLALLPGFALNRRFMEQMMGVRERLDVSLLPASRPATLREQLRDGADLLVTVAALVLIFCRLPRRIADFRRRLDAALTPAHPPLDDLRPDELAAYYRSLERRLLTRWDAPVINDFFAMIFFGALRCLTERWCNDRGTLPNDLLSGDAALISAEPARRMREMAEVAAGTALVNRLREGSLGAILEAAEEAPTFAACYREYLDRFGERCPDELKLESLTLHDDPLPLLRAVGYMAARVASSDVEPDAHRNGGRRADAERRVQEALAGRPMRRLAFHWVLRQARARIRDRENLRFERTRLFGRVRRIFLEFGRRFAGLGLLDDPRDVFHLEVEEILGFVEGTGISAGLKGLAAVRKVEYERHRRSAPPPDRFETRGVPAIGMVRDTGTTTPPADGEVRSGLGCCSGTVRGPVRVVADPRTAALRPGEVLVAERTDPGWVILFPAAAGLVVERGSLLSHSAIVARELGLPAVVSVAGVTSWLKDGDWVELDGAAGVVRRLNHSNHGGCDDR
jgi:rifampicin phosphotransferase